MYNKNRIYIALLILLPFISSTQIFAEGSIVNTMDIMNTSELSAAPAKVVVLTGNEDVETPYDDLLKETPYIPIDKITEPIVFEEGLFVTDYNRLLREKLMKEYPKAFQNEVINDRFFKALAERTYTFNGYLNPDFFNAVINGRTAYFRISYFLKTQKMWPLVKLSLMYLTLNETVYMRNIKNPKTAIQHLSKIPDYPVLYIIDPPKFLEDVESVLDKRNSAKKKVDYSKAVDEFGNPLFGNYVNFEMGENLYYICANFYPKFVNLPPQEQLKLLDIIKSFNITLTEARPIRADNTLVSYIREQFRAIERDHFLKYRLEINKTWLLLPKNLDIYTKQKEAKSNG